MMFHVELVDGAGRVAGEGDIPMRLRLPDDPGLREFLLGAATQSVYRQPEPGSGSPFTVILSLRDEAA